MMSFLIWLCMLIDVTAAVFLIISTFSSDQDAAGKAMVLLPVIVLLALAAAAYFLLHEHRLGWSLGLSGTPAIVIAYFLIISTT